MIKFLQKERVGVAPAAAQSPTRPKVLPSVKETSLLSTAQVTHCEWLYIKGPVCQILKGSCLTARFAFMPLSSGFLNKWQVQWAAKYKQDP